MEDITVNIEQETEVIKALKEEYESKLSSQKDNYENQLKIMRTEHAEQLRTILRTGEAPKEETPQVDELDEVEAAVKRISEKYKKNK